MKLCTVFLAILLMAATAQAAIVSEFAFTIDEISSSSVINLTYEGIEATNPAVPLDFSDVEFDTSSYSGDGSVLSSSLEISGFDGPEVVTIDFDCTRWEQSFAGFPTAAMLCDVTGIASSGGIPTLFGTDLEFDVDSIVITENGADLDDATGEPDLAFFTSASGTGTSVVEVCEPSTGVLGLVGLAFFGILRRSLIRF